MRMLSGTKITPDLVVSFDNGIVYEYIAGDKMTKADVDKARNSQVSVNMTSLSNVSTRNFL